MGVLSEIPWSSLLHDGNFKKKLRQRRDSQTTCTNIDPCDSPVWTEPMGPSFRPYSLPTQFREDQFDKSAKHTTFKIFRKEKTLESRNPGMSL
eukprot:2790082-Amphidinium_carterae.1